MQTKTRWFSPGGLIVYTPLYCLCFLAGHLIDGDLNSHTAKMSLGQGLFVGVGMAFALSYARRWDAKLKGLFSRR